MKLLTTTAAAAWREQPLETSASAPHDNPLRIIGEQEHRVTGFGGCFNEIGWQTLERLPEERRQEVFRALFGDEGCGFTFCRMPIGANDYAVNWYSHADVADDYALEQYSIARDQRYLLPYIRAARAIRPEIRLFASPWSPPSWLKELDRYNGSRLRDEARVRETYAEYFLRFVQAYRAEGIEIAQVHVQNEPRSDQKFPSCLWTGTEMRDFIRDHLGPRFERAGEPCEIWAGTIERGALIGWQPETHVGDCYQNWLHTILNDPQARRYVKGVGYQWGGKGALAQTRASWPSLPLIQTENECGNGENTWDYAFYVFDLIWQYFQHGCSAYVYWNMVLPPGGESTWGWKQNTMITVDPASGAVTYNPEFYVMRHLAGAVKPGARSLRIAGDQAALSLLFENPDGQRVLIVANPFAEPLPLRADIPGIPAAVTFAPRSLNTLLIG